MLKDLFQTYNSIDVLSFTWCTRSMNSSFTWNKNIFAPVWGRRYHEIQMIHYQFMNPPTIQHLTWQSINREQQAPSAKILRMKEEVCLNRLYTPAAVKQPMAANHIKFTAILVSPAGVVALVSMTPEQLLPQDWHQSNYSYRIENAESSLSGLLF